MTIQYLGRNIWEQHAKAMPLKPTTENLIPGDSNLSRAHQLPLHKSTTEAFSFSGAKVIKIIQADPTENHTVQTIYHLGYNDLAKVSSKSKATTSCSLSPTSPSWPRHKNASTVLCTSSLALPLTLKLVDQKVGMLWTTQPYRPSKHQCTISVSDPHPPISKTRTPSIWMQQEENYWPQQSKWLPSTLWTSLPCLWRNIMLSWISNWNHTSSKEFSEYFACCFVTLTCCLHVYVHKPVCAW